MRNAVISHDHGADAAGWWTASCPLRTNGEQSRTGLPGAGDQALDEGIEGETHTPAPFRHCRLMSKRGGFAASDRAVAGYRSAISDCTTGRRKTELPREGAASADI